MAKLNTNSNSYIIIYAVILVVVVAFLLAFVSSSLKAKQETNVTNDVKSKILTALHIETEDVDKTYAETVTDNLWDGAGLVEVPIEDFQTNYNPEIKAGRYHVFVAEVDGETKYVLPVYGMGLWGPIWGYIALNADRQTVFGAYFDHQGETAGLGAEIKDSKAWQSKFVGKKVTDGEKIILGVKKAADNPDPTCEVDAVTGATLTSNGVDEMLKSSLANYLSFIREAAQPEQNTNEEEEGEQ
ncbi:MAG: NADH:ubiquinone reductase (Na(+)-transporting) subunit C [Prevotella sp.]|nr:NADH:ubiquinone reductase (Na(+)-transporting) subunit C [Prevotella sp.]